MLGGEDIWFGGSKTKSETVHFDFQRYQNQGQNWLVTDCVCYCSSMLCHASVYVSRQQYKILNVPLSSHLAANHFNQQQAEQEERMRMKKLTLDINERQEQEDYQGTTTWLDELNRFFNISVGKWKKDVCSVAIQRRLIFHTHRVRVTLQ